MGENPFLTRYYGSEELRGFGFKSVGENVQIADSCTIVGLANISIGDNVRIDPRCHLIAANGSITLGSYIHLGAGCHLSGRGGITMADFSGLSQGVKIYSASDDYSGRHMTNPMVPAEFTGVNVAPVTLGRHVIVGSGSVILPGVKIGDGSAIGALSLVTRNVPEWEVHAGAPAVRRAPRLQRLLVHEQRFFATHHAKTNQTANGVPV